MRTKTLFQILLVSSLFVGVSGSCQAQKPNEVLEEEFRFRVSYTGAMTPDVEKPLLEAFLVLDPEMRVSIEHSVMQIKVLSYIEIDPEDLIPLAVPFGISITP